MIALQESRLIVTKAPARQTEPRSGDVCLRRLDSTGRSKPPIDSTSYRMACMREELHSSMRLVHNAYVRLGLIRSNRFGLHIIPHHLQETTDVLIAARGDEVLATMTIVGDSEYGLPLESLYEEEVEAFRRQGLRVAEVGCLADKHDEDGEIASCLFRLMALTAQRSRHAGIDLLLVAVHPRHAKFYERFLGFEYFGEEKPYEKVSGSPAVALKLDLEGLQQHSARAYKRLFGKPFPATAMEYYSTPDHVLNELSMIFEKTSNTRGSQRVLAKACA